MSDLINELSNPQLLSVVAVIVVVCLERWLQLPDSVHPLTFARLIAQRMAYKVNARRPGDALQQTIAGTLAPLVLLVPFLVVLMLLMYLAEFPLFFESLLLLVALRFEPIIALCKKIEKSLKQDKKTLARHQLQNIVLRKTANLSSLGITKACIESLLLRFNHQYCTVLMVYFVGGGIAAISYRLLFEFSQCWHGRVSRFEYFAKPTRFIVELIQWLPARLSGCCFILTQNFAMAWCAFKSRANQHNTRFFILNLQGAALSVQLSGPIYYAQQKLNLPKCGGSKLATIEDISRVIGAVRNTQWVFLSLYLILSLLVNRGN